MEPGTLSSYGEERLLESRSSLGWPFLCVVVVVTRFPPRIYIYLIVINVVTNYQCPVILSVRVNVTLVSVTMCTAFVYFIFLIKIF